MKSRWLAPLVVAAMWAFALATYPRLPDVVPTHWNLRGEVDGTMPRWPGAFVLPLTATVMLLLFRVLPYIDPRRRNWEKFRDELHIVVSLLTLFFALVEGVSLGAALGWPVNASAAILGGIGLLFVGIGNYLPRIHSNWWMGIRTPWTLSSDRVWRDTHRVGGRAFVAGGLLCAAAALLPEAMRSWVAVSALGAAALFSAAYSYFAWRRESRAREA